MFAACAGSPRWAKALKVLDQSNRLAVHADGEKWGEDEEPLAPPAPHDDATCGGCSYYRSHGNWQPELCYYRKQVRYKEIAYAFYCTDPRLVDGFFDAAAASASTSTVASVTPPRCQSTLTLTVPLPVTTNSTRPSFGLFAAPLPTTGRVGA